MLSWLKPKEATKSTRLTAKTDFPTGLCVEANGKYYLIRNNTRLRYPTDRVWESWSLPAIPCEYDAIKHIPLAGSLGFRDGSLILNYADGKIYLVSANKRRLITSPDVYERYGLDRENIIEVSQDEIDLQREGEPLG